MTVLIIDDSAPQRRNLQRLVASCTYVDDSGKIHKVPGESRTSATIRSGLLDAAAWQPSVILLDVHFKGEDQTGLDAIGAFRAASPRSEIIILTSLWVEEDRARAMKAGCFSYCEKGDRDVLMAILFAARASVSSSFVSEPPSAQ